MAKGIAVKVFSELDMGLLAATVMQMKNVWGSAGKDIGVNMARDLRAAQDDMIRSANAAARAEIDAAKATAEQRLAIRKANNAAMIEEDKRTAAQQRAILMQPIADMKKAQADAVYAQSLKGKADAEEAHAEALGRNAAAASAGAVAFNRLGLAATAGFGIIGAESIKGASSFEAAMTRIQSATDMPAQQISKLQDGLLQLSTQFGVSMKDLTDAAYQTAKAGGIFRDAGTDINFLRDAMKMAAIDGVPLSDVIAGSTTTINDFNISAGRMVDVLARMKTAAGDIKTGTVGDLSRALDNLEPVFAAASLRPGMSQDDRLSQVSQMYTIVQRLTSAGANPDVATDWARNAMQHIVKPTGPQAQFLGGLLAKVGMAPSDLMEGVNDPRRGPLWAFQQVQRAIDASRDAQGNVTVEQRQVNPDIIAKMETARNLLKGPQEKGIADALIADAQSGTIPDKNLFIAARLASKIPEFKGFMTELNNAYGFSAAATNRSTPLSIPYANALNTALGTTAGSVLGQQLYGTPQNAALTKAEYERQQGSSRADLDQSFGLVQGTSAFQLANTKAQMHALAVVAGQELLPAFKQFLSITRDVLSFLMSHKGVLDGFIHSLETMAAIWVGGKIISGVSATKQAFSGLAGTLQRTAGDAQVAAGAIANTGTAAANSAPMVMRLGSSMITLSDNTSTATTRLRGLMGLLRGLGPALAMGGLGALTTSGNMGQKAEAGSIQAGIAAILMGHPIAGGTLLSSGLLAQATGPAALSLGKMLGLTPGDTHGSQSLKDAPFNDQLKSGLDKLASDNPDVAAALMPKLRADGRNDIADYLASKGIKADVGRTAWDMDPWFNTPSKSGVDMPGFGETPVPDESSPGKGKRSPLPGITSPDQIQMPAGTEGDPLYVDPASGFKGMMGANNPLEQFTHASGLWGKHGVLGSMAGLMTTFLAELAFGNPMGNLAMMPGGGKYAWWYQGEGKGGMFGKAEQASNRLANAFDRVNEALARGYGPGTPQYDIAARNYANAQIAAGRAGVPEGMIGGGPSGMIAGGVAAPSGMVMGGMGGAVPLMQNADGTWTSPNPAWAHLIARESSGINQRQGIIDVNSGGNEAEGLFQITPQTWRSHGGGQFAPNALAATPEQQAIIAANILKSNPTGSDWGAGMPGREDAGALMGGLGPKSWWPGGGKGGPGLLPGQSPDFFGAGMGGPLSPASKGGGWGKGGAGGGVGRGFGGPTLGRTGGINQSNSGFETGASKQGFSIPMLSQMGGMAGMAADAFAPGSGALVQLAMQEANRGAQALGEAAATVAGEFPLETFFLSGKDLSGKNVNMASSFIGKVAGGLMGAHANVPNSAGASEGLAKTLDPTKTNPAMKTADNKDPNVKDGNNNNYGVKVDNIHVNNGQNMDDLHKGLNQLSMASPGGAGISRGQF